MFLVDLYYSTFTLLFQFTTRPAFLAHVAELNNQLINPNKDWKAKANLVSCF